MRALHIVPSYEPAWEEGGVVRSVSQLCRGLSGLGIDVTVYTTSAKDGRRNDIPVNEPVDVGGVKVFYFVSAIGGGFRYSSALKEACEQNIDNFDIVHIASFWNYPAIPAGRLASKHRVPYVVSPRGSLVPWCLQNGRLKKQIYMKLFAESNLRNASAIHYTAELERELSSHMGLDAPSFIVPNGLDCTEFENLPDKITSRNRFGLSPENVVVGYLGRLHPRKALDILISAFCKVVREVPSAHLLLAGPDDGHESQLRSLVKKLGLENRVHFLGFIGPKTRREFLVALDLKTLVTYPGENFGNAAVEAMAAGVPVVVSSNAGVARIVETDGAGAVVPVQSEALAQTLVRMLSSPALLDKAKRAAYASVRKRYGIENVARRMVRAYTDILTNSRSPECRWAG